MRDGKFRGKVLYKWHVMVSYRASLDALCVYYHHHDEPPVSKTETEVRARIRDSVLKYGLDGLETQFNLLRLSKQRVYVRWATAELKKFWPKFGNEATGKLKHYPGALYI